MSVRVRFAPSPTGSLHVGSLRDALFKFLQARHEGGTNILRIEDTDQARYSVEAEREFIETLRWCGIEFDEGPHIGGPHAPYRQSERKAAGIYASLIQELLDKGHAYKAFETPEQLEEMREYQQVNKQQVGYFGGEWRDAPASRVEEAERAGKPYVVRQRIPKDTTIELEDAIRGQIKWDSNTVDDPVLIKADGMPTYHFAAMVDDHLMGITHIGRGEEWISSAPKHACLFDQFGWERPVFIHYPVIKGKDGKKLSKRHGATRVLDYRAEGYLPDAILNFVALIGWSPGGDREILSRGELIESFDLAGLQPSSGVFDLEKLRWMNGHYIRALAKAELVAMVRQHVSDPVALDYYALPDAERPDVLPLYAQLRRAFEDQPDYAAEAVRLEQERVQTLSDFAGATSFFFENQPSMDEKAVAKWLLQPHVPELFEFLVGELSSARSPVGIGGSKAGPGGAMDRLLDTRFASPEWCEALVREYAEKRNFDKLGPIVHPIRVALTGKTVGPGLFELMAALGPERMIARLERAKALTRA